MVTTGQLLEVILYVQDMNLQVEFYRDTLGLPVREPLDTQDYAETHWVELETGECTLALHAGGTGILGRDAPKIVFRVVDVAEARTDLLGKGVPMGDVRFPGPGIVVCDGTDPEGNRFSIESRP